MEKKEMETGPFFFVFQIAMRVAHTVRRYGRSWRLVRAGDADGRVPSLRAGSPAPSSCGVPFVKDNLIRRDSIF